MEIEDLLKSYNIQYKKTEVPEYVCGLRLTKPMINYFSIMGVGINLHQTKSGTYLTTLYDINHILNEQDDVCLENNLLIIGMASNGDYLVVNLLSNRIGYVFTDDLSEENYDDITDIYRELPYGIEKFLNEAVINDDYISDGFKAEEYIGNPFE